MHVYINSGNVYTNNKNEYQTGVSTTLGNLATGDMAKKMRRRRMRTGRNKSINGGGGSGAGKTSGSTRSETVNTTIIIVDFTLKNFTINTNYPPYIYECKYILKHGRSRVPKPRRLFHFQRS